MPRCHISKWPDRCKKMLARGGGAFIGSVCFVGNPGRRRKDAAGEIARNRELKVKRGILSVRVVGRMNACSPATVSAKVVQAQGNGKESPVFFRFHFPHSPHFPHFPHFPHEIAIFRMNLHVLAIRLHRVACAAWC